jgi:hypothetical protein
MVRCQREELVWFVVKTQYIKLRYERQGTHFSYYWGYPYVHNLRIIEHACKQAALTVLNVKDSSSGSRDSEFTG